MAWTHEQDEAIKADGNILVSAAAGSGKTAVLTERIVRLVSGGTDISQILVLTFTNAAAKEMKHRIQNKLFDLANTSNADNRVRRRYYDQAQKAASASISTNHAFCMRMLRRYFYEACLSPTFRPIDEARADVEKKRILKELLEAAFSGELVCADNSTLDKALAERLFFAFNGERNIAEVILLISEKMDNKTDSTRWLDESIAHFDVTDENIFSSFAASELEQYMTQKLAMCVDALNSARGMSDDSPKNSEKLDEEIAIINNVINTNGIINKHAMLKNLSLSGKRFSKDGIDENTLMAIRCIRDSVKQTLDGLKKLCKETVFGIEVSNMSQLHEHLLVLRELILAYRSMYADYKKDNDVLDFTDMERMTLSLLRNNPDILNECREKYEYVFVDEYQDINALQNELISLVAGDNNVFLVGDVKQSIYRFREADPSLFINAAKNNAASDANGKLICLGDNFRSSTAVVDFVNLIFDRRMTEQSGEIDYYHDGRLVKKGKAGAGSVELILQKNTKTLVEDSDAEEQTNAQQQARTVAKKIRHMLDHEKVFDPSIGDEGAEREYRYSDFAVLMRSMTNAQEFVSALMLEGIPVTAKMNGGYFDALEVKVFLSLLSAIDNRRQDIPLLALMRSPIGGFTMEEIAMIGSLRVSNAEKSVSVFARLLHASESDAPYANKAKELLSKLDKWHFESEVLSVEELISYLFEETDYQSYVRAFPGGKQRVLNLLYLRDLAHTFEEDSGRGLYSYLQYLDSIKNLRKSQLAERCEAVSDTVTLMTIHGSKGLEFNAVIIPMTERRLHSGGGLNSPLDIKFGNELGFGMKHVNEQYVYSSTMMSSVIAIREKDKEIADELRLLYVALTRARNSLILIGSVKETEKKPVSSMISTARYLAAVPDYATIEAGSYLDWLLYSIMDSEHASALDEAICAGNAKSGLFTFRVCESEASVSEPYVQKSIDELKNAAMTADTTQIDIEKNRKYHSSIDMGIPSKTSVTGTLGFRIHLEDAPHFAIGEKKSLTPTEKGTAMHKVLEKLPFVPYTRDELSKAVHKVFENGDISELEENNIDMDNLMAFFSSDIGKRLMSANNVRREKHFVCNMDAGLIFDTESKEKVIVQGIIDCCFEENGEWVVVDYKTDSVAHMTYDEVRCHAAKHHEKQVTLYATALEQLTGMRVREKYLYFLQFGLIKL